MSPVLLQKLKLLALGLASLAVAAALPIYLRAIDEQVVRLAGEHSKTLQEEAQNQLRLEKPGVSQLLLKGAQKSDFPNLEPVLAAQQGFQSENPEFTFWGGSFADLENIPVPNPSAEATVVQALVNRRTRQAILDRLQTSRRPGVQTLLQNRLLTQTEVFPAVSSAGGAALDAVITAAALLSQGDYLNASFRLELERIASDANRGHPTRALESAYLDILAFAKQMNWAQFSGLLGRIESVSSLRRLAHTLATNPDELPRIFAICWLSPSIQDVTHYLDSFPDTGLGDLSFGLTAHSGGLANILARQARIFRSDWRTKVQAALPLGPLWTGTAAFSLRLPWIALLTKYLAILFGAFCLIRLIFELFPKTTLTPQIFRVEGIATLRQQILALGVLTLFILLGEPFLAQTGQSEETPLNWSFPTAPAALSEKVDNMVGEKVDEMTLLALVLFFLVQAGLYALCLVKLKEIQKQKGSSRLKLKLLDNEDNMFDAGLYVGLGGTVLSLLILTLNLAKVGLMAAYASTLFGIIFVSLLKIFHVRPVRRQILIEAEAGIL